MKHKRGQSCIQMVICFLQRNLKFYSCVQTAKRPHSEIRNLQLYHLLFDYKMFNVQSFAKKSKASNLINDFFSELNNLIKPDKTILANLSQERNSSLLF